VIAPQPLVSGAAMKTKFSALRADAVARPARQNEGMHMSLAENLKGGDAATAAPATVTAGEVFLRRLAENGVDYFFANAGTDFAPVVEAIAEAGEAGFAIPQTVVIPHETAAVGMAHGYYLATGKAQAVMVHTNVGLANAIMGMINAASDQAPMIVASGISPVVEAGLVGHRTSAVAWGQNMRNQMLMVRDAAKWDGTLAFPSQAADLVDRAFAAAMSHPRGPVYLGLPRETLCDQTVLPKAPPRNAPVTVAPDPEALAEAARLLEAAERPLIIAQRGSGHPDEAAFQALTAFAEVHAIAVVEQAPSRLAMSGFSPMHAGFDPGQEIADADVILVLDAAVPWLPHRHGLASGVKVIQAGPDPYHLHIPVRDFPVDVALAGSSADVIAGLDGLMARRDRSARFKAVAERTGKRREAALNIAVPADGVMTQAFVSAAIARLAGDRGRVVSELGAKLEAMRFAHGDQFYANPISGGLGWGMPAALGVQLADRDRLVICTVGDGTYMFANPVACHQIAEALALPILTVVFNNGIWNAVRASTLGIFPKGHAARANVVPLTSLEPAPDYCKVAEASRAWTARVDKAADLASTLEEAARIVRTERRQALVEVIVRV
jgi:acetolactate synthase-1/2/3 large subunit